MGDDPAPSDIIVRFELTIDDLVDFEVCRRGPNAFSKETVPLRDTLRRVFGRYGWVVAIFVFYFFLMITHRIRWTDVQPYLILAPIAWVLTYSYFARQPKPRVTRASLRRWIETNTPASELGVASVTVMHDGISERTNIRSLKIPGAAIGRIEATDQHICVRTLGHAAFLIPLRAFATPNSLWQFIRAVRAARKAGGATAGQDDDELGRAAIGFEVLPLTPVSPAES